MLAAELDQGSDTATATARPSAMRPNRTRATGRAVAGALMGQSSSLPPSPVLARARAPEFDPNDCYHIV